jgi:hypothetical protein
VLLVDDFNPGVLDDPCLAGKPDATAQLFLGEAALFRGRQGPHFLQRPDFAFLTYTLSAAAAGKVELYAIGVFQLNGFKDGPAILNFECFIFREKCYGVIFFHVQANKLSAVRY